MAQAAEASSTFKIVLPPGLHFLTDVVAVVGADTTRGQLRQGRAVRFHLGCTDRTADRVSDVGRLLVDAGSGCAVDGRCSAPAPTTRRYDGAPNLAVTQLCPPHHRHLGCHHKGVVGFRSRSCAAPKEAACRQGPACEATAASSRGSSHSALVRREALSQGRSWGGLHADGVGDDENKVGHHVCRVGV